MRMTSGMFSSTRADYSTPWWLFKRVDEVFGFCVDVCAEEWNAKVDNYISPEMDGLAIDWRKAVPTGTRHPTAWMNPEYGDQAFAWLEKARLEWGNGITTVALLAARTDSRWFHAFCSQSTSILALDRRIRFLLPCLVCGEETDRRRRPNLEKWAELVKAGLASADDKVTPTFPVCDTCQAKDITHWAKQSSNSPAIGSILAVWGWGQFAYPDALDPLEDLGTILLPRESMR